MSLENVVQSLRNLRVRRERGEDSPISSEESDDSQLSDTKPDEEFFCIEDNFLSSEIKVSHNDIGPVNFPIEEETIAKLISVSEKAVFGRRSETVLDTSYRDTQTIPASKLNVEIDQDALNNVLKRIEEELNIQENSKLELHLYNMLIYGKGQFFKRHRDTEKVPNMVATLVIVLPSAHKGGALIIQHLGSKHKFVGSSNLKIIKCITFYADCYHEVEEVKEGFRVALTYNVELKSGPLPDLGPVDEDLKNSVNSFFAEQNGDMLVYLLDHQYTEHSLRWYLLKGKDQTRAKALLALAKKEGYDPCLALADYRETWQEDCEEDMETTTELYFWINEHNLQFKIGKIEVPEEVICSTKDTKENFEPYKREEEGHQGNWAGNIDEWYHRSCVVLWRSTWSYLQGYRTELAELHRLTTQTDMQETLSKKLKDTKENFYNYQFWKDDSVKKMILDIVIYLSDTKITLKVLKKFEPSYVFNLGKTEMFVWISNTWNLELWKSLINAWKSSHDTEKLLSSLLPFLQQYMRKEVKVLEIAEYLLNEVAKFFMNPKKESSCSWWPRSSTSNDENDQRLCALLRLCFELGKLDLEKELMKNVKSASSAKDAANFEMFKKELDPKQFARVSGELLSNITNSTLENIKKDQYMYAEPKKSDIQNICSLLKDAIDLGNEIIEQQILSYIIAKRATFTASFVSELFIKMQEVLGNRVNNYAEFKRHILALIDEQLKKLSKPNDWSIPFKHPCSCQFCRQVQEFFVSSTSTQVIIPAAKNNRAHIYSFLNPLTYMVKLETIRTGSPFKLTVTKLPKLMEDRQKLLKRLMLCKEKIVKGDGNQPAPKKIKIEQ